MRNSEVVRIAKELHFGLLDEVYEYALLKVSDVEDLIFGVNVDVGLKKVSEFISVIYSTIRSKSVSGVILPDY